MILSHLEINFQRLLAKSIELAEKQDYSDWRLEKYLASLEDYLKQLNRLTAKLNSLNSKPSGDTLKDYSKRIDFLKQLSSLKSKKHEIINQTPTEKISNIKLKNPGPIITKKDVKPKQLYHKSNLNQDNLLREKLLSKKNETNDFDLQNDNINKLLIEQEKNQEKIANEMLKSVNMIKENSLLASRILKSDNKLLTELNESAEKNSGNLKIINDDLGEKVSKSCNCWIWLMIMLIMIVFIMMVLFMKLFPKKKFSYDTYTDTTATTPSYNSEYYTHFIDNQTILIDNQTIHKYEF